MKTSGSKFFAQWSAGVFGGTILGIAGFLTMMNYGANYGCWGVMDVLSGAAGYESCGEFGAIIGLIVGSLGGIGIFSKVKILHNSKVATYLLLSSFMLPFLYGVIMFWPPFEDSDLLIVPPVILGFMAASTISSAMITAAINKVWQTAPTIKKA